MARMLGIRVIGQASEAGELEVLCKTRGEHGALERIVLETDSPYLTPVPNRGKRNESAYVKDTLVKVAGIYGNSPEKVAQVTSDNTLKVFGMLK